MASILFKALTAGAFALSFAPARGQIASPACVSLDLRNAPVGTKCRTAMNAEFTLTSRQNGRESWSEPNGTMWSDALLKSSGSPVRVDSIRDGVRACSESGHQLLPTREDYERMRRLGFREVLPNLGDEYFISSTDLSHIHRQLWMYFYAYEGPQDRVAGQTQFLERGYGVRCISR